MGFGGRNSGSCSQVTRISLLGLFGCEWGLPSQSRVASQGSQTRVALPPSAVQTHKQPVWLFHSCISSYQPSKVSWLGICTLFPQLKRNMVAFHFRVCYLLDKCALVSFFKISVHWCDNLRFPALIWPSKSFGNNLSSYFGIQSFRYLLISSKLTFYFCFSFLYFLLGDFQGKKKTNTIFKWMCTHWYI